MEICSHMQLVAVWITFVMTEEICTIQIEYQV